MKEIVDSKPPPGIIQNHLANCTWEIESPRAAATGVKKYGLIYHSAKRLMSVSENHQIHCFILKKHLYFSRWASPVPNNMLNYNTPTCYNGFRTHWRQTRSIHVPHNTCDWCDALEFRQDKIRTHISSMKDMVCILTIFEHFLWKSTMCIR